MVITSKGYQLESTGKYIYAYIKVEVEIIIIISLTFISWVNKYIYCCDKVYILKK